MSLYLGKVHYWLFNKMLWFQNLEIELVNLAKEKGIAEEELLNYLKDNYGDRIENKPLEELIDTGNIHGWLQEKIIISEKRLAKVTKELLNIEEIEKDIEKIYINQGIKAAKEVKAEEKLVNNAEELFNLVNDYILDGMPCDRVNEVLVQEENKVLWKRRVCVHESIWSSEGVEVNYFYKLRDFWIETFIKEANSKFSYKRLSEIEMIIEKIN
ncbi:hypothetical protein [Clostridium sp.]|uniref:hypothetical protein n=1 Tax=Clostridium sp. TaxID=1506 RepID=UPI002625BB95|nr:hypothetical protein [Clostridium sp.]